MGRLETYYDVVIVGSGFGASVMAARLGDYLRSVYGDTYTVAVLERGRDHTGVFDPDSDGGALNAQGNRFRHTLDPGYLAEVGQLYTDTTGAVSEGAASMNVIAGTGLGGGSNLYLAVSLRSPSEIFDQERDGRRLWPGAYSRESLDPYYDVVERMLNVGQVAWTDADAPYWQLATKRDYVFAEGCRRIGATAVPLKLADYEDANEGWWSQGQRFQGRQNLTQNYLLDALDAGVVFHTGCEVEAVAPEDGGYVVIGEDRRGDEREHFEVHCKILIMAAGAVATAGILLRSEENFAEDRPLDLGRARDSAPVLGRNLSANGDYGVHGIVGEEFAADFPVEGHKGKPMSSFCPSFWPEHKFIIIPYYNAPLYLTQGLPSTLLPPRDPDAVGRRSTTVATADSGRPVPHWGLEYKRLLQQFSRRMLTMGCLALDSSEGEVRLGPGGASFEVVWEDTHHETEQRWAEALKVMGSIYEALGGELYLDSYRKDGTVNTAHPLGSARMAAANEGTKGIVDPYGECFRNENLFIVDGAIIPSALGVNPSLTIAAVAEFIADHLIRGVETTPIAERLA
jgi:choline dehydrogenase-like flavoprotein